MRQKTCTADGGRRLRLALLGALALAAAGCVGGAPEPERAAQVLPQGQAWDARMRALYHFTPQGSRMIPRSWFLALERADAEGQRFAAPENLRRYGLIYAADDAGTGLNPDRLPIGLAVEQDGWLGMTCAACHTSEVVAPRGVRLRIEGAPANFDIDRFGAELDAAVQAAAREPARLARLAARTGEPMEALRPRFASYAAHSAELWRVQRPAVESGFGRVDALGQIINALAVLQLGEPANHRAPAAPTSYPFLWTTSRQAWVQWVPIAASPIARNTGEVLGVFGEADLRGPPGARYASTVRFRDIHAIETWLQSLEPPRWPEGLLGAIDEGRWHEGRAIVAQNCLGCHTAPPSWRMTDPALAVGGMRFIQAGIVPITRVGTDATYLASLGQRMVRAGALAEVFGGRAEVPAPEFFGSVVAQVTARGLREQNLWPEEMLAWNGFRFTPGQGGRPPTPWSAPREHFGAIKAGPLVGIWATGPFLRNGSVPTVYDLLSPPAERPAVFWTGGRGLDTERLGFRSEEAPGRFRFDTSLPGNRNMGHAFPATPLTPAQRLSVIEYLKDPLRFVAQ
ncbi:di-heme-cytochrome C peroxidase [Falsiroseomonas sp.]|uniref:di-heme-cytochrome C peroxidase n=1 Tax=Falsiroseomonas sp. TaxID=2870721 RepID=UPI003566A701